MSRKRIKRPPAPAMVRAAVWDKTCGGCTFCGRQMNPWRDFTIDHEHPGAKLGPNNLDNLLPCCRSCNERKGDMTGAQFRELMARELAAGRRLRRRRRAPIPAGRLVLTVGEAARALDVPVDQIEQVIAQGYLRARRVGDRVTRVPVGEIQRWLAIVHRAEEMAED